METVTNLANSASRAIWGEPTKNPETTGNETGGQEPIAGETGDVEAGEPFDKGNMDGAAEDTADTPSTSTDHPSTSKLPSTSTNPSSTLPGNTASTGPIRSEHDTDKTGVTSHHNPTSATSSDKPTSSNDTSGPGPTPSVGADFSSGTQNTQGQQGADRPFDAPEEGSEEHERIKKTKQEAEEAAKVDTSGPGPRALESRAKEGSGNVGGSEDDGPLRKTHGEGTGEKYVKSSGLQADGGDFDAANPGAAREADRLLEEKGIHHTTGITPPKDEINTKEEKNGKEGKVSLKDKIKAKLHKN